MQLELPQDLVARVRQHTASGGQSEAEVIRTALDLLDRQEQERQAIQEGIDAWKAGDVQDFEEFDREFRLRNGISLDDE